MDIKDLHQSILNILDTITISNLDFDGEFYAINKTIYTIDDDQDFFNVDTYVFDINGNIIGKIVLEEDGVYHINLDPVTHEETGRELVVSDFKAIVQKDGENDDNFYIYGAKRLNLYISSDNNSIIPYTHQFYLDNSQLFNNAFNSVYDTYVNTFNVFDTNNDAIPVTVLIRYVNNDFYQNTYFICLLSENTHIKLDKLEKCNI